MLGEDAERRKELGENRAEKLAALLKCSSCPEVRIITRH